ncbi:hypothetical protein JGI13_01242, partial [Candidatus Kryptonium thompsonii]
IAYSYCGIANANRMMENFEKAERYFALATKNYEDIGDKISYAYTLWGEGTLAKVVGDTDKKETRISVSLKFTLKFSALLVWRSFRAGNKASPS